MKILIIQRIIPEYRIDLFNELGKSLENRDTITVCHSGISVLERNKHFIEIVLKENKVFGFLYIKDLFNILNKYDIIIIPSNIRYIMSFLFAVFKKKKIYMFGHIHSRSRISKLLNYIRWKMASVSSGYLFYTIAQMMEYQKAGYPRDKSFHFGNTIIIDNAEYNSTLTRSQFVYLGRVQKRKEILDLIVAYADYVKIKRNVGGIIALVIIGGGDELSLIKKAVDEMKLNDHVRFIPETYDNNEIKTYMQKAIASICPGAVGLSIINSFSYGVPFVTSKNKCHGPEYSHLQSEYNGIIYNGTVSELTKILCYFHDNKRASFELGRNAYIYYKKHLTSSVCIETFEEILNQ